MRHTMFALLGLFAGACGVSSMESATDQRSGILNGNGLAVVDAGRIRAIDAGTPPACSPGQTTSCETACDSTGTRGCTDGGDWALACAPPAEICNNGVDDDCNGLTDAADETCWSCTPGQNRSCTTTCGSTGSQSCESSGQWPSTCHPPGEICNNGVDDDCNGLTDAADHACWTCTPGQNRSCTTTCGSTGTQSCAGNGQWPATCQPPGEVCDNGVDDDCDGLIDAHDFDCPGNHHPCEAEEGNGCNGDLGYGNLCSPADNTGGCSDNRFWAWCNRRNSAYPDIWDSWVHDWVSTRCDGATTLSGATFSCTSSTNDIYQCTTPLVLVFDGAPVRYQSGGNFAFTPGAPVRSDWPTAQTPWLVRDLDGNGKIDNGSELFGSSTRLPDGSLAHDGFEALAALDLNHDGVIDARDPAFASLRLWMDADGDQRTGRGELVRLSDRGVTSLRLGFSVDPRCDEHGNCERERADFSWTDASGKVHTGALVDVWLATREVPQLVCSARR